MGGKTRMKVLGAQNKSGKWSLLHFLLIGQATDLISRSRTKKKEENIVVVVMASEIYYHDTKPNSTSLIKTTRNVGVEAKK
jgi:hypothetical protein